MYLCCLHFLCLSGMINDEHFTLSNFHVMYFTLLHLNLYLLSVVQFDVASYV